MCRNEYKITKQPIQIRHKPSMIVQLYTINV